ncbi:MAG: hypothetical protein AAF488_17615 [Planctomycetota bacterium]
MTDGLARLFAVVLFASLTGCGTPTAHWKYDRAGAEEAPGLRSDGAVEDPARFQYRPSGLQFAATGHLPLDADFSLGRVNDEWDDAERFEVQLLYQGERDIQVQTVTGAYLYYENKRWREGQARVRHESFGIGMEAGALLHPFTYAPGAPFDFAFYPYLRYGIGTADGRIRNVPVARGSGPGTLSGDLGDFRSEGGVGADLRVRLGPRVMIGTGVGVLWWDSLDTAVVSIRNGVGTVIVSNDDLSVDGRDVFARFVLDIAF